MIKLIGAVMVISVTCAWGFGGIVRLRNHVKTLEGFLTAFEIMKSEICERLCPMPELMKLLGETVSWPTRNFFKSVGKKLPELGTMSFPVIWKKAAEACGDIVLSEAELAVLAELGHSLGRYDVDEQRRAITLAQRRLEMFLRKAEAKREHDTKLRAFTGMASGVFAVIILL